MAESLSPALAAARAAMTAGISVVPPRQDGSKAPDATWKTYQQRRADERQIDRWYGAGLTGVGWVTGEISGGLECIDFDDMDAYREYVATARDLDYGPLIDRLEAGYLTHSPHGVHWFYRCTEIAGNTKLARRPKRPEEMKDAHDTVKAIIETRGEGGYIIEAPSSGTVHPEGGSYTLVSGSVDTIATITPIERETLHSLARSFDRMALAAPPIGSSSPPSVTQLPTGDGVPPGTDFTARSNWREILEAAGWKFFRSSGDVQYWCRPGKDLAVSASVNYMGSDLLYVWTSSSVFDQNRSYDRFGAFAFLNYGGDFSAAARALSTKGYGSPAKKRELANRTVPPAGDVLPPADDSEPHPPRHLTDMGNGERFVDRYGSRALYCKIWNEWVLWDGRHWKLDTSYQIHTWAKTIPGIIYGEAAECESSDRREALGKWAHRTESTAAIEAFLKSARSAVPADPGIFDQDPWLLAVRNGTIDLRTGELGPHERGHFITKLVDVDYDPDAQAPRWLAFLARVLPDDTLRAFVQRAAGYSSTGSARERCLMVMVGSGKNGKGVFVSAVRGVLGGYAVRTPSDTFMSKRNDGGIPNDIAALRGARMVFASETNEGRRLAEATIKDLTGGEDIAARFLHGEFFNFSPTFTPWLSTNHKPIIRGTDQAIWDRMRIVPFSVRIPDDEQDPALPELLKEEYPGILAWLVRGAVDWYAHGLGNPDVVRSATDAYRLEMDIIGAFLEDRCMIDPQAWVVSNVIYKSYESWCEQGGEKPISATAFGTQMTERGFESGRTTDKSRARTRIGLRMLGENEPNVGHDQALRTGLDAEIDIFTAATPRDTKTREIVSNLSNLSEGQKSLGIECRYECQSEFARDPITGLCDECPERN